MECLRNNTLLVPDMIAFSSFNIYKRMTKSILAISMSAEDIILMMIVIILIIISTSKQITTIFTSTNPQFFF